MGEGPDISRVAALLGDQARAGMMSTLMSDRALTATELADSAGVTRQTASFHLRKLLDAELLKVERQGRHRYFRIAGPDTAGLMESLMGASFQAGSSLPRTGPRDPALRKARVCYDHLAGELAVLAYQEMLANQILRRDEKGLWLTERGRARFHELGVDTSRLASSKRPLCRDCLDWSERRHHLAGALGAVLLSRILDLGWAERAGDSRAVLFTAAGERSLRAVFV